MSSQTCNVCHNQSSVTTQSINFEKGDATIRTYRLFKGVTLSFLDVHTDHITLESKGERIVIHHCHIGRLEEKNRDENVYIMAKDLSLSYKNCDADALRFPLHHYHGVMIEINMGEAPSCFSCFLEDVNVRPEQLSKKLDLKNSVFIARQEAYIEHIFAEMYEEHGSCQMGYLKIKFLELLLILANLKPQKNQASTLSLSSLQVNLAKEAAAYLSQHLSDSVTVSDLTKKYHVSQTHLQNAFKGVFGVPVSSYQRILKMQASALMLVNTDQNIVDIATTFGYANAGKFAEAFHKIMQETPLEYRKNHRQIPNRNVVLGE